MCRAGSLVFCPLSATAALSLLYLGARADTADSISRLLGLDREASFNPHLLYRNLTLAQTGQSARHLLIDQVRAALQDSRTPGLVSVCHRMLENWCRLTRCGLTISTAPRLPGWTGARWRGSWSRGRGPGLAFLMQTRPWLSSPQILSRQDITCSLGLKSRKADCIIHNVFFVIFVHLNVCFAERDARGGRGLGGAGGGAARGAGRLPPSLPRHGAGPGPPRPGRSPLAGALPGSPRRLGGSTLLLCSLLHCSVQARLVSGLLPARLAVTAPRLRVQTSLPLRPALAALGLGPALASSQADFSGIAGRPGLRLGAFIQANRSV